MMRRILLVGNTFLKDIYGNDDCDVSEVLNALVDQLGLLTTKASRLV